MTDLFKIGRVFNRITPEPDDPWNHVEVVGFHTGGLDGTTTEPVVRTLEFGPAAESVDPQEFLKTYVRDPGANPADAGAQRLAAFANAK